MSRSDDAVIQEIRAVLKKHRSPKLVSSVIYAIDDVMLNEKDGVEFVRLMQKWIACR